MVGDDEALDGEYFVGCEGAEDVGDSKGLGVAVEDDIGAGYASEGGEC